MFRASIASINPKDVSTPSEASNIFADFFSAAPSPPPNNAKVTTNDAAAAIPSRSTCGVGVQTEVSSRQLSQLEKLHQSDIDWRDSRIQKLSTDLSRLHGVEQRQQETLEKCHEVVKKLLVEKSKIERKEVRERNNLDRLRLGQFVVERAGIDFKEVWTDGYAFKVMIMMTMMTMMMMMMTMMMIMMMMTCTCSRSWRRGGRRWRWRGRRMRRGESC